LGEAIAQPNIIKTSLIHPTKLGDRTMLDEILQRIREKIVTRQYVMTLHAEEEMSNDNLSIYDIEQGILTGEILERQKDRLTA
jgi:hypothetical protein